MQNSITKQGDKYILNGTQECKPWTERKTVNGKEFVKEWLILPKDSGTGRTFISRADVDATGEFEFPNKTSGPRVLGSKLTQDAVDKISELQAQIDAIKKDPANHIVPEKVDPQSEEGILAAMARLQAKLSPEAQARLAATLKAKK